MTTPPSACSSARPATTSSRNTRSPTPPHHIGIAEYQLVRALPEPLDTCQPSIEQIEAELGRIGKEES